VEPRKNEEEEEEEASRTIRNCISSVSMSESSFETVHKLEKEMKTFTDKRNFKQSKILDLFLF
jgi:hypothetical protein